MSGDQVDAFASHLAFRGSEDLDFRKKAPTPRSIAREQGKVADGGLRADVEIRQRRVPHAAAAAVQQESLSGQEAALPRVGVRAGTA